MPRQSRGRSSVTPRSTPGQTRGAHTAAVPADYSKSRSPTSTSPAVNGSHAQPQQPGLIAQMAATAGSVAVGSTIGHGISHMLFGGSAEAAPQTAAPIQNQTNVTCDLQSRQFTECLQASDSDVSQCKWYLEQLKACQAAASTY